MFDILIIRQVKRKSGKQMWKVDKATNTFVNLHWNQEQYWDIFNWTSLAKLQFEW